MSKIKKNLGAWLPLVSAALFLLLMFAAADILEEPEIIFPEMAALVIGAWIAKSQPWQVSRSRMVFLLSLSALAGLLFSRYLPEIFLLQASIAFLFALGLLFFSKTTFFPLLSACVLPVLLHTKSFIYPVSVFIMVMLTAVTQWGIERTGLRMAKEYTPRSARLFAFLQRLPLLLGVFLLPAIAAQYTNLPFLIAPPLLVLLLEASSWNSHLRQIPFRVIFLVLAVSALGDSWPAAPSGFSGVELDTGRSCGHSGNAGPFVWQRLADSTDRRLRHSPLSHSFPRRSLLPSLYHYHSGFLFSMRL